MSSNCQDMIAPTTTISSSRARANWALRLHLTLFCEYDLNSLLGNKRHSYYSHTRHNTVWPRRWNGLVLSLPPADGNLCLHELACQVTPLVPSQYCLTRKVWWPGISCHWASLSSQACLATSRIATTLVPVTVLSVPMMPLCNFMSLSAK